MDRQAPNRVDAGTRDRGFSMVELLVGMVIAMLATIVIMQVMANSEAGRRATGNLADSQTSGLLGLFSLERDLQQAGLGMTALPALGCRIRAAGSLNNKFLSPAAIVPAGTAAGSAENPWGIPPGDANSDAIVVAYGSPATVVEGTMVTTNASASPYRLDSIVGLSVGEYMLIAQAGSDCTLARIAGTNPVDSSVTLDYEAGVPYTSSALAYNLGRNPRIVAYAVRNGSLTMCDFLVNDCSNAGSTDDADVWVPVAGDIVAVVGQYGWDTSNAPDMVVDTFCKSRVAAGANCPPADSGSPAPGTAGLTHAQRACDWTRVPMVRVAVVSRSGQYEKDEVTLANIKLWPDSAVAPLTTGPTYVPADRHYRYRVAYTSVALRDVIWMRAQSQCTV